MYSGLGEDIIFEKESVDKSYFDTGADKDFIVSYGQNSTIHGGDGNDLIDIHGKNTEIYGDNGNDTINVNEGSNNNIINGNLGNDLILLDNVTGQIIGYNSGDGNDYIIGYDESDKLLINSNYSMTRGGEHISIKVGEGSILLMGANGKIININGKKIVTGNNQSEEIDTINSSEVIIPPDLSAYLRNIRGSLENDNIKNYSYNNITINTRAGNDTIDNSRSDVTINAVEDDDEILNSANNVIISADEGNDYIGNSGDNVTMSGDIGDDTISNSGNNALINGDSGNDSIKNSGKSTLINSGSGNDYIYNNTRSLYYSTNGVTIDGNSGNDLIYNDEDSNFTSINGGIGSDTIYDCGYGIRDDETVIVDGEDGNDYIYTSRYFATINAGDGDDTIQAGDDTIDGYYTTSEISKGSGRVWSGYNRYSFTKINAGNGSKLPHA